MTLARTLTPKAIPDLTFCSRAGVMTKIHFLKMTQNDDYDEHDGDHQDHDDHDADDEKYLEWTKRNSEDFMHKLLYIYNKICCKGPKDRSMNRTKLSHT